MQLNRWFWLEERSSKWQMDDKQTWGSKKYKYPFQYLNSILLEFECQKNWYNSPWKTERKMGEKITQETKGNLIFLLHSRSTEKGCRKLNCISRLCISLAEICIECIHNKFPFLEIDIQSSISPVSQLCWNVWWIGISCHGLLRYCSGLYQRKKRQPYSTFIVPNIMLYSILRCTVLGEV